MLVDVEGMRSAVYYAAWCIAAAHPETHRDRTVGVAPTDEQQAIGRDRESGGVVVTVPPPPKRTVPAGQDTVVLALTTVRALVRTADWTMLVL